MNNKVVVIVRGGSVENIYSNVTNLDIEVVDWDNIAMGDPEPEENYLDGLKKFKSIGG